MASSILPFVIFIIVATTTTAHKTLYYPNAKTETIFQSLNGTILKTINSPATVVIDYVNSRAFMDLGPKGKRWTIGNETYIILDSCYIDSNSSFDDLIGQHSQLTQILDGVYSGLIRDFYSGDQRSSLTLITDEVGNPIQRITTQMNPYDASYLQTTKICSGAESTVTLKLFFGTLSVDPITCECLMNLPQVCLTETPLEWQRMFCFQ